MKIKNYILHPSNIVLYLDRKKFVKIPDSIYLKLDYKNRINKKLNLRNPQTFNEKLQWLKLYDRKPEYTKMVDKYAVKEYVSNIIGKEYIIPTLAVYDDFNNIEWGNLPDQFVIKCTHDSGGIVICKDKTRFNIDEARKKIKKSFRNNYYNYGREWPYKNVKPRIIVEKYMATDEQKELIDYKLMCFNGKVKCSLVCTQRYSGNGPKLTFFDLNWKKMPFERRRHPCSSKNIKKPGNYELMIKLAEKLTKNIPFLRVDFYEIGGKVYFGELTFYPGGGFEEFNPENYDFLLGSWIELPKEKREDNEK